MATTKIVATEIVVGDSIEVEGWMLHEDLSGLNFAIEVLAVEQDESRIVVKHKPLDSDKHVKTWFKTEETVRLLSRAS